MGKKNKKSLAAGAPTPKSRYDSGSGVYNRSGSNTSSFLFGWNPALREPIFDTREAWVAVAARATDCVQNSGFMAGAVEQACGQMVGAGLRMNAKPDLTLFGGDEAGAQAWASIVEPRFEAYGRDPWECDLGARYTLGQLQDQAVRQYFGTGEIVGTLPMVKRPGNTFATKVNIMPSMRLVQSTIMGGPFNQIQGVILGPHHEPAAYVFWDAGLVFGFMEQYTVISRTSAGRPVVMHLFNGEPGSVRGISPLAPVLKVVKQLDQLADATLTASLLQTVFAGTVESASPTQDIMRALQTDNEQEQDLEGAQPGDFENLMKQRFEWYKNTRVDLGNFGKMVHMFPGEALKLNNVNIPGENFDPFFKWLMREIGRCLCIGYSGTSADYTDATYSSVRQESADLWPITVKRRTFGPERMMRMVYGAWLEEAIESNVIPFPGGLAAFLANRGGACNAEFIGPPRPIADDLKTAKANQILRSEGILTRDQWCAEQGADWRENNRQRAIEKEDDERLGLDPPPNPGGGGQPGQNPEQDQQDAGNAKAA